MTPLAERSLASAPPSQIHRLPFTSFMWAQSEQPGVFQTLSQGCQGTHLAHPVGGHRSSSRYRCGYISCRTSVPEAALRGVAGVPSREVFQGGMGSKLHLVWSCIGEGSRALGSIQNSEALHTHGPAPGKGQAEVFCHTIRCPREDCGIR